MQPVESITQTGTDPLSPRATHPFVVRRDSDEPHGLFARTRSVTDRYDVRPFDLGGPATDVLYRLLPSGGMVFQLKPPPWESWLGEMGQVVGQPKPRSRTTIGDQLAEIQRLTGLGDGQLAAALPGRVARETVNRWRNGSDSNVRPENVYRIGLLLDLSRRMEAAGIEAPVWLHQATLNAGATPFELLCAGRLGDVRQAVENVAAGANSPAAPVTIPEAHREHDTATDNAEDGEAWTWGEWDQDGGA